MVQNMKSKADDGMKTIYQKGKEVFNIEDKNNSNQNSNNNEKNDVVVEKAEINLTDSHNNNNDLMKPDYETKEVKGNDQN